ncbi:hypothetical protein UY3_07404 [Chelonia mydas]|uniref:Uncharacterized protein n=1 Tax=Chelonia mydas TaxID=8469 RepID=M7BBX2_CHEMY|nr:hypothetical protein UY3_07404 [Chelonia mydas]
MGTAGEVPSDKEERRATWLRLRIGAGDGKCRCFWELLEDPAFHLASSRSGHPLPRTHNRAYRAELTVFNLLPQHPVPDCGMRLNVLFQQCNVQP